MNPIRMQFMQQFQQQQYAGAPQGGAGFNPYAAGDKSYGTGRPAPTYGAVDKTGYAMRDGQMAARREALMRRAGGQ